MTESDAVRRGGSVPSAGRRLFLAVVVISSVWYGAGDYGSLARLARELQPLTMEQRNQAMFAPWYAEVVMLQSRLAADASVDFVMLTPQARDIAVLAGPLLQPRDVRYFDGWDAWRRRERARFFHDEKATNAIPGPSPGPAHVTLSIDPSATPIFRSVR